MPYQVSMMGWVGLGPEILGWVGLGFEKVTHDQLCSDLKHETRCDFSTHHR